jgi:hypothetical protein
MIMVRGGLLAAAVAIALGTVAVAQDSDGALKKIWGGGDPASSAYSGVYVPHIISILEDQALSGYVWAGTSDGTVNNALQVTQNPTHVAVGQWDILKDLQGQPIPGASPNPDGTTPTYRFTVLAENIGPECLYMVTDQPGYETFGHVLGNAWQMTIATGTEKSGSFATLDRLRRMYPELADVVVQPTGGAMDVVKAVAGSGEVTHGFFVQRPDPQSEVFQAIAGTKLTLIPIVDFGLEGEYEFLELKVANSVMFGLGGGPKFHTTACTSVALITGDPTAPDIPQRSLQRLKATIDRLGSVPDDDLRPNISSWADMWDNLVSVGAEKAKEMMEASKRALEDVLERAS